MIFFKAFFLVVFVVFHLLLIASFVADAVTAFRNGHVITAMLPATLVLLGFGTLFAIFVKILRGDA